MSSSQQFKADAEKRKVEARGRMMTLIDTRKMRIEDLQRRQQKALDEAKATQMEAQRAAKLDWHAEAMAGFQTGQWWNGLIGAAVGQMEAIGTRVDEGEDVGTAIGNTLFDMPGMNFGAAAMEGDWQAGRDENYAWQDPQAMMMGGMNAIQGAQQQGQRTALDAERAEMYNAKQNAAFNEEMGGLSNNNFQLNMPELGSKYTSPNYGQFDLSEPPPSDLAGSYSQGMVDLEGQPVQPLPASNSYAPSGPAMPQAEYERLYGKGY